MAFALVEIDCHIEQLLCDDAYIGINIDLSSVIEKSISSLDALIERKVNHIVLFDSTKSHIVVLSVGKIRYEVIKNRIELSLPSSEVDILKGLMLDVFVGKGFLGFHYDIDIPDLKNEFGVSFILQKI